MAPLRQSHPPGDGDQLGDEVGKELRLALSSTGLGHKMPAVHVSEFAQSLQERGGGWAAGLGADQVGGWGETEDPDPIHLRAGLRLRVGWSNKEADDGPEKDAAIHDWVISFPELDVVTGGTHGIEDVAHPLPRVKPTRRM